jgi:hypothetical protein
MPNMLCIARMVLAALLISGSAFAGIRFDPVRVFPEAPQRGQPVLLLVESMWPNGCGGKLETQVFADRIEIILKPNRDPAVVCTQALVPFTELINPAQLLPANVAFVDRVFVRYSVQSDGASNQLMDEDVINFGATVPAKTALISGSFSSKSLALSGLFLDQQEGVISTLLSDYDERGSSSWRFGAGVLHGNVYVGDLTSYQQIVCIRAPCPRAAPNSTGKISLLVLNQNEVIARYQDALTPELDGTYRYERMVFTRSPVLPGPQQEESWLPDLVGEWLVGVTGNQRENAVFKRYRIQYLGRLLVDSRSFDRRYSAVSVTDTNDFFEINCSDARPVDGIIGCTLRDFPALARRCDASFEPSSLALGQLRIPATCARAGDVLETEFLMQRLGR